MQIESAAPSQSPESAVTILTVTLLSAAVTLVVACAPLSEPGQAQEGAKERTGAVDAVDTEAIRKADQRPGDWLSHGRTYDEQRFSPLDQITTDNVDRLGLAFVYDTDTNRGLEATPIVVDGILFATGSWSVVWALDAVTGEPLWTHDPEVPRTTGQKACCDVVNRGVAVYDGKVVYGTLDGRLQALDAETGEVLWSTVTVDQSQPFTITGAPRIVKGKVIIGNGGAEYGVRGYVAAYDVETGEQAWRFYTVPGNPADGFENEAMKMAAETWTGEWWQYGGGGTVWDSMAYDPELDLLYIGVGNGSPWNQQIRSPGGGDNLFLSSIVALRPDTGEYVWHFQTTPGDTWDYTATQHIMLADLEIEGEERRVVMQAPKNGFFYVLDAKTGEFISADNYVTTTWATGVDPETGRPIEAEGARFIDDPMLVFPSPFGGHNWQPMAFSPETGLVYIPAQEMPSLYVQDPAFEYKPGQWNLGTVPEGTEDVPPELVSGSLLAWDPVKQEAAWRAPYDLPWSGGALATAGGLVFQGTPFGMLTAYDAKTGEKLWEAYTGSGVIAAPMTYEVAGEQYVAVLSGWGGAFGLVGASAAKAAGVSSEGRLVAFKLGGSGAPIERVEPTAPRITRLEHDSTQKQIDQGRRVYHTYCVVCHGYGAVGGGVIPDIRYSPQRIFDNYPAIVHEGRREEKGMPKFDKRWVSDDDLMAIRAYVLHRRDQAIDAMQSGG